jgi:hypothetical protein
MTTARQSTGSTHRTAPRPDIPVDDGETSFAAWTHTTMLDEDTMDDWSNPTVLRGID